MNTCLTAQEIKSRIIEKLHNNMGVAPDAASDEQYYKAVALMTMDLMKQRRAEFMAEAQKQETKQIYYLCMEFLLGRSLKNNLFNLGLERKHPRSGWPK